MLYFSNGRASFCTHFETLRCIRMFQSTPDLCRSVWMFSEKKMTSWKWRWCINAAFNAMQQLCGLHLSTFLHCQNLLCNRTTSLQCIQSPSTSAMALPLLLHEDPILFKKWRGWWSLFGCFSEYEFVRHTKGMRISCCQVSALFVLEFSDAHSLLVF